MSGLPLLSFQLEKFQRLLVACVFILLSFNWLPMNRKYSLDIIFITFECLSMCFGSNNLMMKVRTHQSSKHCRILWRLSYEMLCIMGLSKFQLRDYLCKFAEKGEKKMILFFFITD